MRPDRDEILAATDLAALWAEKVGPRSNGGWPCPAPTHAQTGASPPVALTGGLWFCHGCGAGGTAVDLLGHTDGLTVADAFAWLAARAGLGDRTAHGCDAKRMASGQASGPHGTRVPGGQASGDGERVPSGHGRGHPGADRPQGPPDELDTDRGVVTGPEAEEAMAGHLAHRGWHPVAVDVFGLTVVRSRSGLAIRHPYRNDGRVVWWQDRSLGGDGPKWLAPSGSGRRIPHAVDLRRSLEAAPTCDGWPVIIVVEGPADVVSLWHVAPGACVVGLPGTSRPQRWAPLLAGALVLIATDADDAGDKAAAELAPAVHAHGGRSLRLRPPEGLDVTDWRQRIGDDAAFLVAIEDAADRPWWSAAEGVAA